MPLIYFTAQILVEHGRKEEMVFVGDEGDGGRSREFQRGKQATPTPTYNYDSGSYRRHQGSFGNRICVKRPDGNKLRRMKHVPDYRQDLLMNVGWKKTSPPAILWARWTVPEWAC